MGGGGVPGGVMCGGAVYPAVWCVGGRGTRRCGMCEGGVLGSVECGGAVYPAVWCV